MKKISIFFLFAVFFVSCTFIPEPPQLTGGKRYLYIFHNDDAVFNFEQAPKIKDILDKHYIQMSIRLSSQYDRDYMNNFISSLRKKGIYRENMKIDRYLLIKKNPMDKLSMKYINKFKLTQTPELVVVNEKGRILGHYVRHHTFADNIRINEYEESGIELKKIFWNIEDREDRMSLLDFLRKHAE